MLEEAELERKKLEEEIRIKKENKIKRAETLEKMKQTKIALEEKKIKKNCFMNSENKMVFVPIAVVK